MSLFPFMALFCLHTICARPSALLVGQRRFRIPSLNFLFARSELAAYCIKRLQTSDIPQENNIFNSENAPPGSDQCFEGENKVSRLQQRQAAFTPIAYLV